MHGVLVVPGLHRVYATATAANQVVSLDEDIGAVLGRAATGAYPDGLAYDPTRARVWTTNETGGSETVLATTTGSVVGTVEVGGEAGNVAYDPGADQILVPVQTRDELAVIDPVTLTVGRRMPLPGCDHDHGLALDPVTRLAFVACDGNATLLTVALDTWQVLGTNPVVEAPDVLAFDPAVRRLYVAGESGWVSILDERDRRLGVVGSDHLADGAHVVAVDPVTHHSYYPLPTGSHGQPTLLEQQPTG